MPHDNEQNGQDESTLRHLRERREAQERMGGSTDSIDQELEAWESEVELLTKKAELQRSLDDLDGVAAERAQAKIEEIDEVVKAPVESRIEELEAEADSLERQVEPFDREGWDEQVERAEERIEENRTQAEALRTKLEGESSASALSASSGTSDLTPEPDRSVSTTPALRKLGVDPKDEAAIEAAINEREERVDVFEDAGKRAMAKQVRSVIEVLEAAKDGVESVEVSDPATRLNFGNVSAD